MPDKISTSYITKQKTTPGGDAVDDKSGDLIARSGRQHLVLLYEDDSRRSMAEAQFIDKALQEGQFCIYASVDMHDPAFVARFAAMITGYDDFVNSGNLLVVDFKPYYESALEGRLDAFERLRTTIEEELAKRALAQKNTKTLIIADAACNLTKNREFARAAHLEAWWQNTYADWMKKGLDISIFCAHPSRVLQENADNEHVKGVLHNHSQVLDLRDLSLSNPRLHTNSSSVDKQDVPDYLLSKLEAVIGPKMFQVVLEEIEKMYLGNEMDARQCLVKKPELFERAFCATLGSAGRAILSIICKKVQSELQIERSMSYKGYGDLEKFLQRARKSQ